MDVHVAHLISLFAMSCILPIPHCPYMLCTWLISNCCMYVALCMQAHALKVEYKVDFVLLAGYLKVRQIWGAGDK